MPPRGYRIRCNGTPEVSWSAPGMSRVGAEAGQDAARAYRRPLARGLRPAVAAGAATASSALEARISLPWSLAEPSSTIP